MEITTKDLGYQIIKDIADFKKETGIQPSKILMKPEIYNKLKENWKLTNGKFEGIEVKSTGNINKLWILI